MQKNSGYQLLLMGTVLASTIALVNIPSQAMKHSEQHIYIPFLIVPLFLIFFLWLMAKVANCYPDQHLFDVLLKKHPKIGRFMLLLYLLFFFSVLARDLRILTDFTNIFLLRQTPILVIAILFIISIIFIVRGGIEVIGRMTEFFVPIFILVILSIPILLVKEVNTSFFHPLYDINWSGIGVSSWYIFGYMSEILLLPFLASAQTFSLRNGIIGLSISTGVMLILVVFELLVLGVDITARNMFPSYQLVRQINITDFLDRFELIMVSLYYPSAILKMAYMLYLSCICFNKVVLKVPVKLLSAPLGLIGTALAFWMFEDNVQLYKLNGVWPIFGFIFGILFPILFFLLLYSKEKESIDNPGKQIDQQPS